MPNDCWNNITFTADPGDLYAFINIEFKDRVVIFTYYHKHL